VQYIDKHGRPVDPASIKVGERLQAISDWGPNGPVIQQIMVDRD